MNEKQKNLLAENYNFIRKQIDKYQFIPPQDKADCVSYVNYKICQNIDNFNSNNWAIEKFLRVAVRTYIYNYFQQIKEDKEQPIDYNHPASDYWKMREKEEIKNGISELDNTNQHIILLYYFDGLTEKEISAILGKSIATISRRLHKALDKLRPILKEKIDRLDEIRSNL